jgi:PTS system N-acetylgalactosamine-specific IIC component
MSGMMAKADKAAAEANPAGITQVHLIAMGVLGGLFAVCAVLAYVGGSAMAEPMTALKDNLSWLLGGLGAAGGMMRNVGFAVLLKIMLSNDLWGIFFAGFAAAAILGNIAATSGACLILVAFIGVAIAINDFNVSLRIKENAGNGGMSDGI